MGYGESKPLRVVMVTDPAYWVELHPNFTVGQLEEIDADSPSNLLRGIRFMTRAISEWNLGSDSPEGTWPIDEAHVRRLIATDTTAILEVLIPESQRTPELQQAFLAARSAG